MDKSTKLGVFSASQIHRLMGGVDDPQLLDEFQLTETLSKFKKLSKDDYSASTGKPLLTAINKVLSFKLSAQQRDYAWAQRNPLTEGLKSYSEEKALELMTEYTEDDGYQSGAMQHGIETELPAINLVEFLYDLKYTFTGEDQKFIVSEDGYHGCTPDGLLIDDRTIVSGIEIKCPDSITHYGKYLSIKSGQDLKDVEPKYYWQIQHQMLVTGANKWVFCSYDPRFNDAELQIHTVDILRNKADHIKIKNRLILAEHYKQLYMNKYTKKES